MNNAFSSHSTHFFEAIIEEQIDAIARATITVRRGSERDEAVERGERKCRYRSLITAAALTGMEIDVGCR